MTTQAGTVAQVEQEKLANQSSTARPRVWIRQTIIYMLLLMGAALVLIPFAWMISTSLKTPEQLFVSQIRLIPNPVAPENYAEVWSRLASIRPSMTFWRIMSNTLFITISRTMTRDGSLGWHPDADGSAHARPAASVA